jgi:hypothetical protein
VNDVIKDRRGALLTRLDRNAPVVRSKVTAPVAAIPFAQNVTVARGAKREKYAVRRGEQ